MVWCRRGGSDRDKTPVIEITARSKKPSMGYHLRLVSKEIPLERIFRKIIGKKMPRAERISFHLKPASPIARGKLRKSKL
jgi:hypothetical protein